MFGWPLSELYGVRRCFPKVWEASFFECYQLSQEEYVTMLILDQCFRKIAKENKVATQFTKLAWLIVIGVYK